MLFRSIERNNTQVITRIVDSGNPFDYNSVMDPDLEKYIKERRKGGFGIYLVRQLNDEVRYERNGNINVLTLINNIEPRPSIIELIKKNFKPTRMTIRVRFAVIATVIISVVSAGTFFLAVLTQRRTLTREYINNYVSLLINFHAVTWIIC